MSLTAAALEVLVSKGLSAQDILDVARALEVRRDPTAAERQQRKRERDKAERDASRVTSRVTPPNDIYSNPPVIPQDETIVSSIPKPGRTRKAAAGMAPLPDDWEPVLTAAAQEIVDRWPPGWLEARVAEFRDHATDKGRKSKDWQAAFRTWITKADNWQTQENRNGNHRQGSSQRDRGRVDGFTAALRKVANRETDYPFAGNG